MRICWSENILLGAFPCLPPPTVLCSRGPEALTSTTMFMKLDVKTSLGRQERDIL